MTPIIQTEQLTVGYKTGSQSKAIMCLPDISVYGSELIGIIGQNGIGKSTLLRTIARLQQPLSGTISLYGQPIERYTLNEYAQKVSFVSTEIIKLNHCTVRQLV